MPHKNDNVYKLYIIFNNFEVCYSAHALNTPHALSSIRTGTKETEVCLR